NPPADKSATHGAQGVNHKITFTIPGRISGKGRPRFSRKSGVAYTPAKTVSCEAMVRHYASEAMERKPPIQGPVRLEISISLNTPKSWSKKKREQAYFVTGRPDLDNCGKLISDALNNIVYADDSQISDLAI